MCGIAGIIDLAGRRPAPRGAVRAMTDALFHRGPDEHGYLEQDGISFGSRRLSIVGLADGQQPIANEDRTVHVVFNGELFDHRETRARLEVRGHRFSTHCDTEVIPHLWEEYQEGMFEHLKGQFAFALWDERQRVVVLGRDRFGICPLFWTKQDDRLLFASEIKSLLASGLVPPEPDWNGINHAFTFFAMPGPVTCFAGVRSLIPGHYLHVPLARGGSSPATVSDRIFWSMDFPDRGEERSERATRELVDEFEVLMLKATERRLRADVPVVSYLSGGVDSSVVVALASHIRGEPIPTYTIRIKDPSLDETSEAAVAARHIGARPVVVDCGPQEVLGTYPRLVHAAESPVIDTSCTALLLLAQRVNADGYKVALTGEGADEWLAGYPWYKVHKALSFFDLIPGVKLSQVIRRAYQWITGLPRFSRASLRRTQQSVGGHNGWLDMYGLVSASKLQLFSPEMRAVMEANHPYTDLELNRERLAKWHPLNRALYLGARVHLPGLLLNAKGDRVAMHSSVETRYPFLDEEVFSFLASLHPRLKMRGFKDKYILRLLAERWLPHAIAHRKKAMFRAPLDSFHVDNPPPFVEQLLSPESLRKTGYFDADAVALWRQRLPQLSAGSYRRISLEMGLVGVVSTQLWHQTFIDGSLADVPRDAASSRLALAAT
jgi:asparagine synthase (glutamine-hydrolysing)